MTPKGAPGLLRTQGLYGECFPSCCGTVDGNTNVRILAQLERRRFANEMTTKIRKSSGNVFLDLGFPPHEAAVMLLRAQLAEALRAWMDQSALTQADAAKKLGVTQPRISEITRGKVELLSLDYLVGLCAKAGIPVKMRLAA